MAYRIFPLRTNAQRTYILLTDVLDWLEPEIHGGNKKSEQAVQLATVQYGSAPPFHDDIAGKHKFFRQRKIHQAKAFLDEHGLQPGDLIKIERIAPFSYRFTPG